MGTDYFTGRQEIYHFQSTVSFSSFPSNLNGAVEVIERHGRADVHAYVEGLACGKSGGHCAFYLGSGGFLTAHFENNVRGSPGPGNRGIDFDLMLSGWDLPFALHEIPKRDVTHRPEITVANGRAGLERFNGDELMRVRRVQ